jgi:hypothetical protein
MTKEKIAEIASAVKLRREKDRFEPHVVFALYRARCVVCAWRWRSETMPERPELARVEAKAHRRSTNHRTETVFDILGQLDEVFLPRDDAEIDR